MALILNAPVHLLMAIFLRFQSSEGMVLKQPSTSIGAIQVGEASWYARGLPKPEALTCASRLHPRGSKVLVIHGWRYEILSVNDYGPEEWTGRIVDLSLGAARKLNLEKKGVGQVIVLRIK